jgi:hypothetical protein
MSNADAIHRSLGVVKTCDNYVAASVWLYGIKMKVKGTRALKDLQLDSSVLKENLAEWDARAFLFGRTTGIN